MVCNKMRAIDRCETGCLLPPCRGPETGAYPCDTGPTVASCQLALPPLPASLQNHNDNVQDTPTRSPCLSMEALSTRHCVNEFKTSFVLRQRASSSSRSGSSGARLVSGPLAVRLNDVLVDHGMGHFVTPGA